ALAGRAARPGAHRRRGVEQRRRCRGPAYRPERRRRLDARVTRLRGALHRIDHLIAEGIEGTMTDLDGHAGAATTRSPPGAGSVTNEKLLASQLFNEVWRLMEQDVRTTDDDDRMIHMAHSS